MNKPPVLALAAIVALAGAGSVSALYVTTYAHAGMCSPATNDLTRTTYGIRNNTTGNRSVYCGFEIRDRYAPDYFSYGVYLRNHGATERSATCYWTSGTPGGGGYASATTTVALPADGEIHFMYGSNLSRPNEYATLGVRCVLPPGVALEYLEFNAQEPAF